MDWSIRQGCGSEGRAGRAGWWASARPPPSGEASAAWGAGRALSVQTRARAGHDLCAETSARGELAPLMETQVSSTLGNVICHRLNARVFLKGIMFGDVICHRLNACVPLKCTQ